jgi:hypothetical protein
MIRHAVLYMWAPSNNSEQLQIDITFLINSGEEQNLEMLDITFQLKNSYYIYLSKTQQIKLYIVTCSGYAWLIITGFGLGDWIYWHCGYNCT